jgi:hypothetical protein
MPLISGRRMRCWSRAKRSVKSFWNISNNTSLKVSQFFPADLFLG